jgi:hypothetical protein
MAEFRLQMDVNVHSDETGCCWVAFVLTKKGYGRFCWTTWGLHVSHHLETNWLHAGSTCTQWPIKSVAKAHAGFVCAMEAWG